MSGKARRQHAVLSVIEAGPVRSQEELLAALARKGIEVSQATLSRDLRELGVARVPGPGGTVYSLPQAEGLERLRRMAALEILSVDSNESLVLVKTWPGRAQGVGVCIDALGHEALLGTVAGDDTILVVPRSARKTAALRRAMEELMEGAGPEAGRSAARGKGAGRGGRAGRRRKRG